MSAFAKKALIVLAPLVIAVVLLRLWVRDLSFTEDNTPNRSSPLSLQEAAAEKTYWAKEILAEECGRTFESLWDAVNAATNKFEVLAQFPVGEIVLPQWSPAHPLIAGMALSAPVGSGPTLSSNQISSWIDGWARQGWRIDNLEFRHRTFDTDPAGQPWESRFYFAARLTRAPAQERAVLEGDLIIRWGPTRLKSEGRSVTQIDASHLTLTTGPGAPLFERVLQETIVPSGRSLYIDPLILYDLDGDGLSEIVLAAKNLVYHRSENGHYESRPLCRFPLESITSAVIADFDGDGAADLLCATSRGLWLFSGSQKGAFDTPPRLVWLASPPLKNTMVLTCGDIDRDGDLDVFLGQYKTPDLAQILRPFYYDANDSWPSHLLINDGKGNFTDATEASGLSKKRWRRTYSASFADLDGDGHLDLVVVSDFAGLDLYRNDGHGHFTEVTQDWVVEPHAFGMAHTLADFNLDGRLDLLMIGMTSPTVDRLEHLGLSRPYSAEDRIRRPAMAMGNHLYLAEPGGGFALSSASNALARSGWSWGCSAFDLDNDGFPDLYVANGLESKQSVRDYEQEFWLHDIFIRDDVDDVMASKYFMDKFSRTRGQGWSYGGYEKNRLFLNQGGGSFLEIGHLAGVALEQDSRNVVTDDLDGDGRVDLLVTTFEAWPEPKQTLQIYRNRINQAGHWIGFRFREEGKGKSPVGVAVTIQFQGHSAVREIVTGDSHRSQHATTLHFGIGQAEVVDEVKIRWADGQELHLTRPGINAYHNVVHP